MPSFYEWSTHHDQVSPAYLRNPVLAGRGGVFDAADFVLRGGDPALEAKARTALQKLNDTTPKSKELQTRAKAVLVFPDIVKAGLIVGAQGGNGVMFDADGKVLGYYNATALSYGLQAGVQSFSEAMYFMTDSATSYLAGSDGWSVGMGPSIVVVDEGMGKSMTTTTLKSDVYAFIFGQQGLMAGMGLQGQKITKLNR
ncbi:lipid-binding SYLF domain-containing protein [Cupriavidus sp. D39]|uniref:lipid-binding SYLF domain-containing protein n=1 Tax=Cupriavidus sp. D39 TaxID=2997877 RepID=UPI00226EE02A|nr:lipid-binding SYLF domain-containing protein [Cupriavidus sp. D39]MCY0853873.1 lipid-binding SYLF domain-containing protein [Cupriavidus sp. D39]